MDSSAFVLVLAAETAGAVMLAWALTVRTRSVAPGIGLALIYYFSLLGAWFVITDLSGADNSRLGFTYYYLFDRLFDVALDRDYFNALLLHGLFLTTIGVTLLVTMRRFELAEDRVARVAIAHGRVIAASAVAGALAYALVRDQLAEAASGGLSAYVLTRANESDPVFSIGAVLSRMALVPASLGVAIWWSGTDARLIRGAHNGRAALVGYVVVLAALYAMSVALGNKNELLFSLLSGGLFYLVNARRPRRLRLVVLGGTAVVAIAMIEILRAVPIALVLDALSRENIVLAALGPLQSNEIFAAHFSMYGVLHYRLPYTWGASLVNLAVSVVPRVLWPSRPPDVYSYYATNVGSLEGQGYTIHHDAGWYLNWGVPGVVVGACVLALVWSAAHNAVLRPTARRSLREIFVCIAPCTMVAGLPALLRGGPEAYKGLVINSFLVPTIVLALATWRGARGR
ncbi:MAG: hypothetical protein U0163_14605 [Gemmatimonadaceae bacterium]